jgi:Ser/Thr protein kinase RdoA (MazF antagonist)
MASSCLLDLGSNIAGMADGDDLAGRLTRLLDDAYGLRADRWDVIDNGDEAAVWRADGPDGTWAVHLSPAWRGSAELTWVHQVVAFAATDVPEAITPVSSRNGDTFAAIADQQGRQRLVTVSGFREGTNLDRDNRDAVEAAGRLLGRIHRRLMRWRGPDRPAETVQLPSAPRWLRDRVDDPSLDAGRMEFIDTRPVRGVIHGDYYRRNLLCHDADIRGVVDWHETRRAPYLDEVAWATWEFAHDDHHNFQAGAARVFLNGYAADGPPVAVPTWPMLVCLMRHGLRNNICHNTAATLVGRTELDMPYLERQITAFWALRDMTAG